MISDHAFVPKDNDRFEYVCKVCNGADDAHKDVMAEMARDAEKRAGRDLWEVLNADVPTRDELHDRIVAARRYVLAATELKELL